MMLIEIQIKEGDRYWNLEGKSQQEIDLLIAELIPFLDQPIKMPDGKFYVWRSPSELN